MDMVITAFGSNENICPPDWLGNSLNIFWQVELQRWWGEQRRLLHATAKYGKPHRNLVQSKQRVLWATAHRGCWVDLPKHSHLYTNMTIPVKRLHKHKIKKGFSLSQHCDSIPRLQSKISQKAPLYLCWFPSWTPEPSSPSSVLGASAVSEACFFSIISPRSNMAWSR